MKRALPALASLVVAATVSPSAFAAPRTIDYRPMDVGPEIRTWDATAERISNTAYEAAAEVSSGTPYPGCATAVKIWMVLNTVTGTHAFANFFLVADGPLAQVWVQVNLAWPAGDPRPTPMITCEQAQYMLGQFEDNIYPKESSFFGMADAHDGADSLLEAWGYVPPGYYDDAAGRQVVLISNIRDPNYYDPTYPNYTSGFFSPSMEAYFDRNVVTIDAYDWANRIGTGVSRPHLYEGVFAHEYQHLLHADYDSDEESWIDEGMADYAMVVTGYPDSVWGHLGDTADLPENSLVLWGDQGDLEILADYGNAFLFQYYLAEKLGEPFIQTLFLNPGNSISGVDDALATYGSLLAFPDLYHDWATAKLINSRTPNDGFFQFKGLPEFKLNIGTSAAPNPESYDTPGAGPWATDYIWIDGDPRKIDKLTFNGLDYTTYPTQWTVDAGALWSGTGDLRDHWAIFETDGGGTLSLDALWDLEDFWDFGFVQVSTDGGYTWTSLADNEGFSTSSHDPNAHAKVVQNLPGLTGSVEPWPTWVRLTYDLGPYAGQDILIAFRMITDWETHLGGWWIDNVYVDDVLISDGTDASVFRELTEVLPINNDFTVSFVGYKSTSRGNQYKVVTIDLGEPSEEGFIALNSILRWSQKAAMLVTLDAAEGFEEYVDYSYEFVSRTGGPPK